MQWSDITSLIEQFTNSHPETLNAAVASGTGVILFFIAYLGYKGAKGTARFTFRRVQSAWNWLTTSKPLPPEPPPSSLCQYILTALKDPRTERSGDRNIRAPSLFLKVSVPLDSKTYSFIPENLESIKSGEEEIRSLLPSAEQLLVLIGCWEAWKASKERADSIISAKVINSLQKVGVITHHNPETKDIQAYLSGVSEVNPEIPSFYPPPQQEASHHPVLRKAR